ncbi:MAG: hypothetical protein JWP10_1791, partial [Nocardioidaceae bacterium]|nr:hypothetical protein [Nocardioidaceae bacterium]
VTGTRLEAAASASLLLDLGQIRGFDLNFDPALGLSGGEDTLFSRQLVQLGGRIVWCQESVTEDHVPAERLSRRWALHRAMGHGATDARVTILLAGRGAGRMRARVEGIVGGVGRCGFGGARYLLGVVSRNVSHRALGLRMAWRGRGMIVGSLGRSISEYERST